MIVDDASARTELAPSSLLRRLLPLVCALAIVSTIALARSAPFEADADGIAFMDIADCLRAHRWACAVNGYWNPMYPALLALGRGLAHASVRNEARVYLLLNCGIALLGMGAVLLFTRSLALLRTKLEPAAGSTGFLFDRIALQTIAVALLLLAVHRELAPGVVRPDLLLAVLLIAALAELLRFLATGHTAHAAAMGAALGCAFLTKSFALAFAVACVATLLGFSWRWNRRPGHSIAAALVAFACFAALAAPYISALSRQKGRLDFGDSGALNYAWYTGRTARVHLQPYMTLQFGASDVLLKHPQRELLTSPQIVSYAALPYGTNPDWFDPSYWNDGVRPRFNVRFALSRFTHNLALTLDYLRSHLESLALLALLLAAAAYRRRGLHRQLRSPNPFWLPTTTLALFAWTVYAAVNIEERYVSFAFLTVVVTAFAALRPPAPTQPAEPPATGPA
ncbi:MAG: hypothetical protein M3O02_03815, partial [Acidobacteriota bacterium]|nr:hypothetical protein [Acidobacteriota bacterium]